MPERGRVWVLDTSALVDFKTLIGVADQWDVFRQLEALVDDGSIAMPRQVLTEVGDLLHPDMPGTWASGMRGRLRHRLDVDYSHLKRVMAEAGDVVDQNKTQEDADPYVVALALELQAAGYDPCVVTSDVVDRLPIRIALTTACDRLGVGHTSAAGFLLAIGVRPKRS